MSRRRDRDDGFSLIELMTVTAIIAILVSVAIASYAISTSGSRRVACLSNQRVLIQGIMVYQSQNLGRLPGTLDDLRPYVKWPGAGFGMCTAGGPLTYEDGTVSCTNHVR
jgi:prepilin-type N-terminal cleavage/methylation domain-containing protein